MDFLIPKSFPCQLLSLLIQGAWREAGQRGWGMESDAAQIYLCPPGPLFPSTHPEHQDQGSHEELCHTPPSADSL